MTGTPTYRSWVSMWARCTNPARKAWVDYGLRGIKVCNEWKSFERFVADMGIRPDGKTLERKDNKGNYEPSNCYWADRFEQAWNRRSTIWIEHEGKRLPRSVWAKELGVSDSVLTRRLAKYPLKEALTRPS